MKIARPNFDHQVAFNRLGLFIQDFELHGLREASGEEERAICAAIQSGVNPEECLFRYLSQLGTALRMDVHVFMGFTEDGQPHWLLPPGKTLSDSQKTILEKYAERTLQLTQPIEPLSFIEPVEDLMAPLELAFGRGTVVSSIPIYSKDGKTLYGVVFMTHPITVPSPRHLEWGVAYIHVYERGKPLQMLFDESRLSVVPQPTLYSADTASTVRLSLYDSGVACLDGFTLSLLLRKVRRRGSIQDVATFLDEAANLIGYKTASCKKEYLFNRIKYQASREEAEDISKTSSQSVESISRTASKQPWEQTLPAVLEMMAVTAQEMPAVYWVMPNVGATAELNLEEADHVDHFVIQHNPDIPDPSPDEAAALRAVAHWAAIRGDAVYDDPKKKFPFDGEDTELIRTIRPILGDDIPIVAIPVYDCNGIFEDKPVYHGTFVGLRNPGAKYPTAVQLLTWAMMAQYLLDPIRTAKSCHKLDYKPVDMEKAAQLARRISKSARRLVCSTRQERGTGSGT